MRALTITVAAASRYGNLRDHCVGSVGNFSWFSSADGVHCG